MTKQILVVDDDLQTRTLVRIILERRGFKVLEADGGQAALRLIETVVPDLLIIDIMMPGMDGFELCRHLRARAPTAKTPIVMFSAAEGEKASSNSYAAGADAFLPKTSPPLVLARRVQQLLGVEAVDMPQ